ncbi:MAG: hybrid sensor histidine kinase/response regulator [Candidatus Zixiibacteriota bacterium]
MSVTAPTLPLEKQPESVRPTGPSLVVVDDNPKNLKLLEGMLKGSDYQVRLFPRAQLALAAAIKTPPDLFLLDINMPEMDGYQMCAALKADPTLADIPVIFLSALTETTDKVKAFEQGGVDYITKPFHIEEVRVRIETHLQIRRQRLLLEKSYQQLKDLEKLRDSLVHMIVHDMRTPLTVIYNGADLMFRTDGATLSEKGTRWLTSIQHRTGELIEMVNSLLDISKFESGQMTLNCTRFDIAALVQKITTDFSSIQTHHITSVLSGESVWITADESLVARVIQNLVGNAIKYAPKGTDVQILLAQSHDTVSVSVVDQGPGIPPEHRARVFDKFFQIGQAKNSSGLGLAFCKLAIDAHGGKISVDAGEAVGSTFSFWLPSAIPSQTVTETAP